MGRRLGRRVLSRLFSVVLGTTLLPLIATAQGLTAPRLPKSVAPQSLVVALETFAEKTGYQVVYRAEVAVGLTTQGIEVGADAGLSTEDTLRQLLRNTGLGFAFVNDRTVAIFKLADGPRFGSTATLDPRSVSPDTSVIDVGKDARGTTASSTTTMGVQNVTHPGIMKRIAGALALFVGSFASAADNPSPEALTPTVLEQVTVTARRREESAQTVPIAITAFGADALEEQHITNLENIQSAVPEFSISQSSGRPNAPVYGLRGIRPTEAIYGQDPTVAVYFADVVMSPAEGTNLGLYDLASLQVLKGPQGTLFGRNTTGGALLMTPRRPGKAFGANLMIGYGSFGRAETQVGVDMPFADSFAMRLAGRTINSDGYQTNVEQGPLNGSKLGGESTQNARLSALWNITDKIENYTILNYDKKNTNGRGTVLQAINPNPNSTVHCYDGPGNPYGANHADNITRPGNACLPSNAVLPVPTPTPPPTPAVGEPLPSYFDALTRAQNRDVTDVESDMLQYDKIKVWSVINTTTAKLGDNLTLKGIGGYREFKADSAYDIDASQIPGILTSLQNEELTHASYEVQLLGNSFDNHFDWVAGLYWYYEDGFQNSPGDVSRGLSTTTVPFTQAGAIHNNTYSAFAQGTYNFAERWSLTAGARWTRDEKEMVISTHAATACALRDVNGAVIVSTGGDFSNCHVELSDSFSKPTGTLSLDYKLSNEVLLYAASRYGYRAGGFNLRGTAPISYAPFQPETVTDLEVGTKADWSMGDWKMRSNVAVYRQWYNDIQRTVGVSTGAVPGSAVQNAAKASVLGVELQQTIAPTRNLSILISYAYTNPKYDNWTEVGSDPIDPNAVVKVYPIVDLSDTPFHFTPEHAATGTVTYTVPLANSGEELLFSASAAYRSGVWINPLQTIAAINRIYAEAPGVVSTLRQEGYTTLDLNAGWNAIMGSALDLAVYVKNATDKEYAVGGIQLYESSYTAVSRTGFVTRAYGEPRTFGAELRYRF